ncbi:MAG: hypothetical protein ABJ308_13195 [Halieaceae bacterium]
MGNYTEKRLIELLTHKAEAELVRRGWLNEEGDLGVNTLEREMEVEDLREQARFMVPSLFDATSLSTRDESGERTTVKLDRWHHRDSFQIADESWELMINNSEVYRELETYLASPWLWCEEMDWLFLQFSLYGVYLEVYKTISVNTLGIGKSFMLGYKPHWVYRVGMWVLGFLWWLFKWGFWLVVLILATESHWISTTAWVGLTAWIQGKKLLSRRRFKKLRTDTLSSYQSINNQVFGWRNLERIIADLQRDWGAIYDSRIMRLIEIRQQGLKL